MTEQDWQQIITKMEADGWTCDKNTDETLGFIILEDEDHEWIRDYDKKDGTFVQFNGRQVVNLRPTNFQTPVPSPDTDTKEATHE